VGGASGWVAARHRVPEMPTKHMLGAAGPGPYAFFDNQRAIGRFWITDPLFGAKCDGATDDHDAILAAETARAVAGGTVFISSVNPAGNPSVCLINSELATTGPIEWGGAATSDSSGPVIKAGAAMRSLLVIRSTFGAANGPDPPGPKVEGLILDGNRLAKAAILTLGDYGAEYRKVFFKNAIVDGMRRAGRALPLTVGSIATGGGAPGGVTITQPDPNTGFGMKLENGVYTWVVKFTAGGGLGAGVFALSIDGGATFSTATQTAYAVTNLVDTQDPVANAYGYPSGLVLNFPSQAYPLNGTYTFTVQPQTQDTGSTAALNTNGRMYDSAASYCGTVFATATPYATYAGSGYSATLMGGSIATATGAQIVTGTGTTFLSMGAREGDILKIGSGGTGNPGSYYPIAAVLDDTHIAVARGAEPTSNASGLDFSISVGSGYWEDGATENNTMNLHSFRGTHNSSNLRVGGLHGVNGDQVVLSQPAIDVSIMYGSSSQRVNASVFTHPDLESSSSAYIHPASAIPGGVTFLEPGRSIGIIGPGPYTEIYQGNVHSVNGPVIGMFQNSSGLSVSTLTLASASTQIPAPDTGAQFGLGHTSYVKISSAAPVILTGTPTIGLAPDGTRITLINSGYFPITLQTDTIALTGLFLTSKYVTLGHNDVITFISTAGGVKWAQEGAPIFPASQAGNSGVGTRVVKTTNATATVIWDFDVGSPALIPGTVAKFDVTAQARDGIDLAWWAGCVATWASNSVALQAYTCQNTGSTAGNAAAWTLTMTAPAGFVANLRVTGDVINPVYWSAHVQPLSPPVSW